jgi:hypothetical protein
LNAASARRRAASAPTKASLGWKAGSR